MIAVGNLAIARDIKKDVSEGASGDKKAEAPAAKPGAENAADNWEAALPRDAWKTPFKDEVPLVLVTRGANSAAWDALKNFWNEATEKSVDPLTGASVERKVVKIKVPLGLNVPPPIPVENPLTLGKWKLGKQLYFDTVLSSDGSVSCASCHDPARGYTDQSPVSTGIMGNQGGVSAPSVFNSVYHPLQFWDGRARSLEDQSQGPPQNPLEMFDGKGNAWQKVVERIREKPDYVKQFKEVFGTLPTRDAVAKAIATYERTVFSGNSIHDRAELAMRNRLAQDDSGTAKPELTAKDYEGVLKAAFDAKDTVALKALNLDSEKDSGKVEETAKRILAGRNLYFGKARCNACHVGENFSDNSFHNLGVGAKDGELPASVAGRFGALPTGHKNPEFYGAFKTPTVRAILSTAPYMHNGGEKTIEEMIEFYNRGGNVNPYLDVKMRDENAERAWYQAKAEGKEPKLPEGAKVYDGKVIIPLKLNLSKDEVGDLAVFLRALQGDDPAPLVANPKTMP